MLVCKEQFFDLYEMRPGFYAGFAVTTCVSLVTKPPYGAAAEFEAVRRSITHYKEKEMPITETQIAHFHRNGFFLIPNLFDQNQMRQIDRLQQDKEGAWEKTAWPEGMNVMACQFLMLGEPVLQLAEHPSLIHCAKQLLDCDRVHIGACGCGDASKIVSADGRRRQQVHWHADGSPEVKQVSIRIALDRHDPTNAPLRVLPGSHVRSREEMREELTQLEIATGQYKTLPDQLFARHPHEVEITLDPHWALIWTPSCWHATGVKTAAGPRRAMAWNYFPPGGRQRDTAAVRHIYGGGWAQWPEARQRLWGLID